MDYFTFVEVIVALCLNFWVVYREGCTLIFSLFIFLSCICSESTGDGLGEYFHMRNVYNDFTYSSRV